ncbi:LamG-like jellyroll fold domain-containing protein [Planctomycetota bacterium]
MFAKSIISFVFLSALLLSPVALAESPEVVAQYSAAFTNNREFVSADKIFAMGFEVTGSPTVSEVQIPLSAYPGYGGTVTVELRSDSDGKPASTYAVQKSMYASDIPLKLASEDPGWITFKFDTPTSLSPGLWWIVCKPAGTGSGVAWYGSTPGFNQIGEWYDTKYSSDGITWDLTMSDLYFKVFGTRAAKGTITTVEADPDVVEVSLSSTILVTVTDENSLPIMGYVNLSATDGTLDANSLTLDIFGKAWTTWTAPGSTNPQTITVTYPAGQGSNGTDYNDSNDTADISVEEFTGNRDTSTAISLSKYTVKTHEQITVTAAVTDISLSPVTVDEGKVTFSCSEGKFSSPNPVSLNSSGVASLTWTSPDINDTFTITAAYNGDNFGTYKFKTSSDSNDVDVEWRDFYTTTTLTVSPVFPYVTRSTYVWGEVRETTGNTVVPGGAVKFTSQSITTPQGWFDSIDVNVTGLRTYTKWNCPAAPGDVNVTVTYQGDQPFIAEGCRYFSSSDTKLVTVVKDSDDTDGDLSWFSQWISDYSSWEGNTSIASTQDSSEGFQNKLSNALGWGSMGTDNEERKNSGARAYYMRYRWMPIPYKAGKEYDHMDEHDFTWYNGHGNQDLITFTHPYSLPYYDRYLKAYQTTSVTGNPKWGDEDAEWVAFKSCKVLSNPGSWAGGMNGLHLICGFHTNSRGSATFGPLFAGFMIKDGLNDPPHSVLQSWFMAGGQTQPHGRRQVVIGEIFEGCNEYIWGQGAVFQDTVVDGAKVWSQDVNNHVPVADAGGTSGVYNVVVGQGVPLNASATTDADTYSGATLYYRWDMNVLVNTDACDFDYNDFDGPNDDGDVFGVWGNSPARYVFNVTGTYDIKLMVRDDVFNTDIAWAQVVVSPAPSPIVITGADPTPDEGGEQLEIIDTFNPFNLPTVGMLPMFRMAGTLVGYDQMLNIGSYYGMTTNTAGQDELGSWSMFEGNQELIINQNTGGIMYIDKSSAYLVNPGNPAPMLPSDSQALTIANGWLMANTIPQMDVVFENITDLCHGNLASGEETYTKIPYQRHVNYRRILNVIDQNYPVVGPGGKITILIDGSWDVRSFIKIWRDVSREAPVPLTSAMGAIDQFHQLGQDALIKGCLLPVDCEMIEVNNVSLGYFEDDFVTSQEWIAPVYILDLICISGETTEKRRVYMPAMDQQLLDIEINSPSAGTAVDHNDPITFTSIVHSGFGPFTYEWSSDVDGVLSSEPNFTTSSLSARRLTESCSCEMLPHSIRLTVTDIYGGQASRFVDVTVRKLYADVKPDGIIDSKDFAVFAAGWRSQAGDGNYDDKLDFDDNNSVDANDLCLLAGEWLLADGGPKPGYWAFDDGDGNTAVDSGTGGNDCTLFGDANWVTDDPNRGICLNLDGSGDYAKTADATSGLNFAPNSFTISTWINPRTVTGNWRAIAEYDRYDVSSGTNWFGIWISNTDKFHFRVGLDTQDSIQTLTADKWYLVTATYEASTGEMKLYIDGQYDSTGAHSSGFGSGTDAKLTIGTRGSEDAEYFDGMIDDMRIYGYALNAEQILSLYNE